jgi:selenide,water dikinase
MPLALAHPGLLVDAATSDDAAVYQINETTALIATTDFFTPIVDDPFTFGRIAAANALSDIYAMGGRPIFSLAVTGMPIGKLPPETIRAILAGGQSVADAAGAPVAGGHSIDAAEPIYGLVALGLAHPANIKRNSTARSGDVLILGKPLGIGIFSAALKRGTLSDTDYDAMIASTTRLNAPGAKLAELPGVHAMTDVTGFGLIGHAGEMARGANVRIKINKGAVPVFPGARALAEAGVKTGASGRNWNAVQALVSGTMSEAERDMLCDPQTSGGLLVACAPDTVNAVLRTFQINGHDEASVIGAVEAGPAAVQITA